MTVTYSATQSFLFLLFQWRGSVWKAVSYQYIIYLSIYYSINLIYRFAFNESQQTSFEHVVTFFKEGNRFIPVQFLLGFYVSLVITHWWNQMKCISWPDKFVVYVCAYIRGTDDKTRKIRRTISRYANLLNVLVWREICVKIKKRFPTTDHLEKAGFLTENERKMYEGTSGKYGKWFLPVSWMVNILARCREEGRITDLGYMKLTDELWLFRSGSAMLCVYDWINIPLVYTQVVTLATYGYFALTLVGRQFLRRDGEYPRYFQLYFPLFTTLEFLFYIGWLKVGEHLRCPFGEDDDDFDMNYILDRNVHVSSMLVDDLYDQHPEPQDTHWDNREPVIPHTKASYKCRDEIPSWRLSEFKISEKHRSEFDERMRQIRKKSLIEKLEKLKPTVYDNSVHVKTMKL